MPNIVLNSKVFSIPFQFEMMNKISQSILIEMINGSYQVQSNVGEEILLMFIEYLISGKNPEIHFGNYYMLDQINQLAKEFKLTDLEKYILQKKSKWEEYELYIENEINEKNQEIHQLQEKVAIFYRTTQDQRNEINSLKQQLINERINNQNNIAEQHEALVHIKEELMSNIQQIDEKNKLVSNECDEKLEKIKMYLENNETRLQQQSNEFNEQKNLLKAVQNQFDSLQNQFSIQQEKISKFIEDENVAIEQIKLVNNENISNIEKKYITKENIRSAVDAAKAWSRARENCPYHLAYQAILCTFGKFEEEI